MRNGRNNPGLYLFNGMLELSYMMLRYLDESGDASDRRGKIFRFIEQTLLSASAGNRPEAAAPFTRNRSDG